MPSILQINKKLKHFFFLGRNTFFIFTRFLHTIMVYGKQGYQAKLFFSYTKHFFTSHFQQFNCEIKKNLQQLQPIHHIRFLKLQQITKGLHSLLPFDAIYSYAILLVLSDKDLQKEMFLKKSVEAALNQTALTVEILIGCSIELLPLFTLILQPYLTNHKVKIYGFTLQSEQELYNALVEKSTATFVMPLLVGDWLRPDFLYRCEQTLRFYATSNQPPPCLYTDEFFINSHDYPLLQSVWRKAKNLCFPYVFKDEVGHTLFMPRLLWLKVKGLTVAISEGGLWEMAWRLSNTQAHFCHLPFPLYAHRTFNQSPIFSAFTFTSTLLKKCENLLSHQQLDWSVEFGLTAYSFRAIPVKKKIPSIQVIILFKDQKQLTLQAIDSICAQKNVQIHITAVDNNSTDKSIASTILKKGAEVLSIAEPFNFSRLNNLAVKNTKTAKECEFLLFLNNDVYLQPNALEEMSRWLSQPKIGMVGCLLEFPNKLLQHGGVDIKPDGPADVVTWIHSEKLRPLEKTFAAQTLRVTEAVTAACSMIPKSLFEENQGFDEIWYPIAYSDTSLALKLRKKGWYSLYTPYAQGVHHESISRAYENIEDVENSRWLQEQYEQLITQAKDCP